MTRFELDARWARWSQGNHNHAWAWTLRSDCPACRAIILKEVRLWN